MLRPLLHQFLLFVLLYVSSSDGFTNPIKSRDGSDPQMAWYDGMYYLTTTTWTDIRITAAPTIEGLKTATPKVVWTDSNSRRCCNVWAPEMHRLNGRWYIYYTAGARGDRYVENQRTWVIQGGTGTPLDEYTFLGQVQPPNYSAGMLDSVSCWALRPVTSALSPCIMRLTSWQSIFTMTNGKTYYLVRLSMLSPPQLHSDLL